MENGNKALEERIEKLREDLKNNVDKEIKALKKDLDEFLSNHTNFRLRYKNKYDERMSDISDTEKEEIEQY